MPFMRHVVRNRLGENRWTSLGYLVSYPSFHPKVKRWQFWKSELSKFQHVQHIHQKYQNLWIIVSYWLSLWMWTKLSEAFRISGTSKFLLWFLWYLQNYECKWEGFPLRWDTSWISLVLWATVFITDGEILFLFNSKYAFFLLYPSAFSTVRSIPQDIMSWLCGISGLNCWPCNDSTYEISRSVLCHQGSDYWKNCSNIWFSIESNFKTFWSLLINC